MSRRLKKSCNEKNGVITSDIVALAGGRSTFTASRKVLTADSTTSARHATTYKGDSGGCGETNDRWIRTAHTQHAGTKSVSIAAGGANDKANAAMDETTYAGSLTTLPSRDGISAFTKTV
jgi:hypothetical protein